MVTFLDALRITHNAGIVEKYIVLVLIQYLTDVWEIGIIHAAGLIKICFATTKVLPLVFLFLLDNYISSYSMLIVSTTASALGMGLMSISTPSWHYRLITGSCSEYKMECVSEKQQSFFYLALVLTVIGRSSREATMGTLKFKGNETEQASKRQFVTSGSDSATMQAGFLLLAPWSILFGVSSVLSSIALFLLMEKSWSHKLHISKPETSPVTTFFRVFVVSISKISRNRRYESPDFYQIMEIDDSPLHCSSTLRFLEKAAIRPTDDERKNKWMLCSLQEVEDTKTIVRMLIMGVVIVIHGLLSSISSNYSVKQAKRLKPGILFGMEIVNISYLYGVYTSSKIRYHTSEKITFKNNIQFKNKELHEALTHTMYYSTMFYSIAALVEKSRSGVIRKHGIANKPGEVIPMSMFWYYPQFIYLGKMDASFERVVHLFFYKGMPLSKDKFQMFIVEAIFGVCYMISVLAVYVVGEVSKKTGILNWFELYTEDSRVDLFYWSLTAFCVVVLTLWVVLYSYLVKRPYPNSQQQQAIAMSDMEMNRRKSE